MTLRHRFRKFLREDEATVTIEFLLTFPILVGTVALGFAVFHAHLQFSRATKAVFTIADVVSLYEELTDIKLAQLQALQESITAAPAGSVLRVSRIDYIDKIEDPAGAAASDGYETDDGFYEVAFSVANPMDGDVWCSDDLTVECTEAERITYELRDEQLADYDLPIIGNGAHILLVDGYTPYNAPVRGGVLGFLTGLEQVNWSVNVFVWPRNIKPIVYNPVAGGDTSTEESS